MTSGSSDKHPDISFPDGGYGWVCVGCCLAINALTWGVVASYAVYLNFYLSSDSFKDATQDDFAFIGGLNFGVAMAMSPLVTFASRRFGPRPTMFIGTMLLGAGFIASSFATLVWHLYVCQGALVGAGVGFLYLPSINILPQWFDKKRSLASAISAAGSGLGGLIFSFSTGAMITQLSLQWALRITGIVTAVVNIIAVALVRDRDAIVKPNYAYLDIHLLSQMNVVFLLAWEVTVLVGYITIQFSISDFATSIGLSSNQSTTVAAVLNVSTACGRPFIGLLSDKFGGIKVASILTLVSGGLCFAVWIPAANLGGLITFAILIGGIYGVFWAAIGPLCAELVGVKNLPSLLSLAWIFAIPPTSVAEFLSLKLRRPSENRSYLYSQILAGGTFVVASIFLWILSVRKREDRS